MGFFAESEARSKPTQSSRIPQCGACKLKDQCNSPKMEVTGRGKLGVLVVAEAPGKEEDRQGVQLVGDAGQLLRDRLDKIGVDLDRDCWKTNALICRPPDNRKPTEAEIEYCRPNLINTIEKLQPRMIMLLGGSAVDSMISPLWRSRTRTVSQWAGWRIPLQRYNCWVTPTFHPSYVKRSENDQNGKVVDVWFRRHLAAAFELEGRPWPDTPSFADRVKCITDVEEAAQWVRDAIRRGDPCAFDYETNCLKAEHPDAEIVVASICRAGEETIAYPFVGEAIDATREFVRSSVPKIGANNKFEDRWSHRLFGSCVKKWVWDTMLSAHHLDNRPDITSVDFQAFVRIGQEPWNYHIKPFLSSTDDRGINRIREIKLKSLLVYCGMDTLMEYLVAVDQKREMKERMK